MCQKFRVKNASILLRMLLIVGLMVSPLYPRVFDADAMAMSETHMSPDQMSPCAGADHAPAPCHDGKMDCGKIDCGKIDCDKIDCDKTCMAACMSLSVQGLPSIASTLVRFAVVSQRITISSEGQLASLAASPPARPPRA
jgi:hypothetical protein